MTRLEELEALRRKPFVPIRQSATTDHNGEIRTQSVTYVPEREPHIPLPDALISRRSTLKDSEGKVIQEWLIEKPDDRRRYEAWQEVAKALAETIPPVQLLPAPQHLREDLLTVYPIGDHHIGMLAWKHEVGRSYDLDIAEAVLSDAVQYLVNGSPASEKALVAFLGDFVHYDSMAPLTPAHGNILDADGRAAKMVRVAARTARRVIETAAQKHRFVHVIFEFGNHDPYSTLWIMELMNQLYADNTRITIDTAPGSYHYYRFGKCLFGTHHGDKAKASSDKLPAIMAHDRPQDWGETTHRLWMTGHVHSRSAFDYPGCTVESFRILAPVDAWAHMMGFRGQRDMKALVFDAEDGEVARHTVNPSMLEKQA
jgi:hypothetical protein